LSAIELSSDVDPVVCPVAPDPPADAAFPAAAFVAASAAPACAVPPSPTVDPEAFAEPAFDLVFDAVPADVEVDDPDVDERESELELRDDPLLECDEPPVLELDEEPDVDELDDEPDVDPEVLRVLARPLPLDPGP